ncbi:MAG: glycosyltransferase [Bacteroidota bacterium]
MILFSTILLSIYLLAILLLLLGLLSNRWLKTGNSQYNLTNGISVIVAFRNERQNLPKLVASLELQDLPLDFWEAILVDDGSTDNGMELVKERLTQIPLKLLVLPTGQTGKKQALLYGISVAKFDTIVFTDADCAPNPQWLSTIAGEMAKYHLVQGEVKPQLEVGSLLSRLEALDYLSLMAVSAASFSIGRPVIASSANLAFKLSAIKVDGKTLRTDIASGDDMFLLHHAKTIPGLQCRFLASPQVAVQTTFGGGIKDFLARRTRWASKASAYSDSDTLFLAALVFVMNFWIVLLFILSFTHTVDMAIPFTMLAAKTSVDFPFLAYYLFKTQQQKLLAVFIPLQVVYPFYISFTALAGLLKVTGWKGRTVR